MDYTLINIISIIFISFNILILILICKMHLKQISIREGFFKIVFTQIIIETLLNLLFLIILILSEILGTIKRNNLYILSSLFDFFFNVDILYNIQTINKLINAKNKVDSDDIFSNRDSSRSEEIISNNTIEIEAHSFKRINLYSFFSGTFHTVIYFIVFYKKDENSTEQNLNWHFYFINNDKNNLLYLLIFIFNYIFIIQSVRYFFMKQKINEGIKLRYYSLLCLITSIISLIFPMRIILNKTLKKEKRDDEVLVYIFSFLYLFNLIIIGFFRLNSYYVQYILSKTGNSFSSKLCFGIKILFTKIPVPSPNFIDFNNSFLYHSISSEKDFNSEKERQMKDNDNDDLNLSRSFSLTES